MIAAMMLPALAPAAAAYATERRLNQHAGRAVTALVLTALSFGMLIAPPPGPRPHGAGLARRDARDQRDALTGQHRQERLELHLGLGELSRRVRIAHDSAAGIAAGQLPAQ